MDWPVRPRDRPAGGRGWRRVVTPTRKLDILQRRLSVGIGAARRTVANSFADHRAQRRVDFFLVPVERGQVPVWVFKPADALDAVAALVMNLSDGGAQVLTADADALAPGTHEIQLLLDEEAAVPRFRGRVSLVWTRKADGLGWLSGLRFVESHSPAEDFLRVYQAGIAGRTSRRWVRCLLMRVMEPAGTNGAEPPRRAPLRAA